jgi:hypothetical protein
MDPQLESGVVHMFTRELWHPRRSRESYDIRLEWDAEVCHEDVDLILLQESLASSQEQDELALVISNRGFPPKLNQFAQHIATKRRAETLIDQLDELLPCQHATIALDQGVPLSNIASHVEGGEEDFVGGRCILKSKELITPVQP